MKKYFFPCNLTKYDIMGSFLKNGFVDYGTQLSLIEGDQVFIYAGAPYSGIFLKCNVRAVLSPEQAIDDTEFHYEGQEIKEKSNYVRLVPIANYLNKLENMNHEVLKEHGLKGCSFQLEIQGTLLDYLNRF